MKTNFNYKYIKILYFQDLDLYPIDFKYHSGAFLIFQKFGQVRVEKKFYTSRTTIYVCCLVESR